MNTFTLTYRDGSRLVDRVIESRDRPLRVRIGQELWYNSVMPENYIVRTELTDEEKKLAAAAASASRDAVQAAFAAGLSITIGKNGKLVEVAPDGTETIIGDL